MKILRSELYRRVWKTPITTLAKEFDISDVGLAKACRKHSIPLPPVGHWTKVAHGKRVSQPSLPKADDVEIALEANRHRLPPVPSSIEALKPSGLQVRMPASTKSLTPIASATLRRLLQQKPDDRGMVSCQGNAVFRCAVSPKLIDRAVRILHAIEMSLPEIGARLTKAPEHNHLQVERDGIAVTFRLLEKLTSTFEVFKDPKHIWNDRRIYSHTATGSLVLQVEGHYDGRKSWADGKREALEDKLGLFLNGLVVGIESIREKQLYLARQQAAWAEAAKIREELERQRREDEAFKAQLLEEATAWKDFELVSDYMRSLRSQLGAASDLSTGAQAWLHKAEQMVSKMDPSATRLHRLLTLTD